MIIIIIIIFIIFFSNLTRLILFLVKESCLILLQTIPGSINIDSLKMQLLKAFPDIINVHDLHVWQLTAHKVISTAHIIFQNPTVSIRTENNNKYLIIENYISQNWLKKLNGKKSKYILYFY